MQTLLSLALLTFVISVIGLMLLFKAYRSWRTGRVSTHSVAFNRQQQGAGFGLTIGFLVFGGMSFLCWATIMVGMMGLTAVELAVK
jgi:hypothetical protein